MIESHRELPMREKPQGVAAESGRPDVFAFVSAKSFVKEMLRWRAREDKSFSVKSQVATIPGCSPSLVSRVARGERRLTRDKVQAFSHLLGLKPHESHFLDYLASRTQEENPAPLGQTPPTTRPAKPSNHLFADWLNIYVKDACRLRNCSPDPIVLHRALGGMATLKQIKRSLDFLFREGFLRRTIHGDFTLNEEWTVSTDDVPDRGVRNFHRKALEIAKQGLDRYPLNERRAETLVFALDDQNMAHMLNVLRQCMDQVAACAEKHATDDQRLYQVTIHLTPITGDLS